MDKKEIIRILYQLGLKKVMTSNRQEYVLNNEQSKLIFELIKNIKEST